MSQTDFRELEQIKTNSRCIADRVLNYSYFLLNKLGMNNKETIIELEELYKNLRVDGLFQGNPLADAAALVYTLAVLVGHNKTQHDIVSIIGITEGTLKRHYFPLAKYINNNYNPQEFIKAKNFITRNKPKPFHCDQCNKSFRTINYLNIHLHHHQLLSVGERGCMCRDKKHKKQKHCIISQRIRRYEILVDYVFLHPPCRNCGIFNRSEFHQIKNWGK